MQSIEWKLLTVNKKWLQKYVPWCVLDNMSALVPITAWRRIGDRQTLINPQLSPESTMSNSPTHTWQNGSAFRDNEWIAYLLFRMTIDMCRSIITMTSWWARWRLKSPASRVFTQAFIQAQMKENIKAPRHWPLCGEFTGDRWIPRTNGQ